MLKICNPGSLHDVQIPYKICLPSSSPGSFALQGNPEGCSHIALYRKSVFGGSFVQWTHSDHLFAILAYTLVCRQCCALVPSISAALCAWVCFAFFILTFICKIFPVPAKLPPWS